MYIYLIWYFNLLKVRYVLLISFRYDIGIVSTFLVAPGFLEALHNPSSGEKGLITAIYYAGELYAGDERLEMLMVSQGLGRGIILSPARQTTAWVAAGPA
jgi:hypothetical protein